MTYTLTVIKNLALIDYDMRLLSYRELQAMIARHKMIHPNAREARRAAEVISQHPLVASVIVTQEAIKGAWQNGRRTI